MEKNSAGDCNGWRRTKELQKHCMTEFVLKKGENFRAEKLDHSHKEKIIGRRVFDHSRNNHKENFRAEKLDPSHKEKSLGGEFQPFPNYA